MERIVCFDEISHGRRKQRWMPSQTEPGWQGSTVGQWAGVFVFIVLLRFNPINGHVLQAITIGTWVGGGRSRISAEQLYLLTTTYRIASQPCPVSGRVRGCEMLG